MLNEHKMKVIWELFLDGVSVREMEKRIGVPKSTCWDMIVGKTHKNWEGRRKESKPEPEELVGGFRIKDRVYGEGIFEGKPATVVCFDGRWLGLLFDEPVGGHNLIHNPGTFCEDGYGWYVLPNNVTLITEPTKTITIEVETTDFSMSDRDIVKEVTGVDYLGDGLPVVKMCADGCDGCALDCQSHDEPNGSPGFYLEGDQDDVFDDDHPFLDAAECTGCKFDNDPYCENPTVCEKLNRKSKGLMDDFPLGGYHSSNPEDYIADGVFDGERHGVPAEEFSQIELDEICEEVDELLESVERSRRQSRVLAFTCAHLPYEHPFFLQFLEDIYNKHRCNRVVCLGDLIDKHAMSFHTSDPNMMSAGFETKEAIRKAHMLRELFPKADWALGNHDLIALRKAHKAGVSDEWVRTPQEVLGLDWNVADKVVIDGVLYRHQGPASLTASKAGMSVVQGHEHSKGRIIWHGNEDGTALFSAQCPSLIDKTHEAFAYGKTGPEALTGCTVVLESGRLPLIEILKGGDVVERPFHVCDNVHDALCS